MKPGPDVYLACPHCKAPARQYTLSSMHLGPGRQWTDGKGRSSFAPEAPWIAVCPACAACSWLRDMEVVDEIDPWDETEEKENARRRARWAGTPNIREPSDEEYYAALASGQFSETRDMERGVRLLAWWRRNEPFRYGSLVNGDGTAVSPGCRANLEALAAMLDDAVDAELVLRAEIHRELGEFDASRAASGAVVSGEAAAVARRLEAWCDLGDRRVQELTDPDPFAELGPYRAG
jgi:hypothetical protein